MTIKKIFSIAIITSLLIFSCSKDDVEKNNSSGFVNSATVKISPSSVSIFDQEDLDYELFTTVSKVTKLDIQDESLEVNNKRSTYTTNFTDLGITKIGDKAKLKVVPFIGNTKLDTTVVSISAINPVSFKAPKTASKEAGKEVDVNYSVLQPKNNSIATIKIEKKISKTGAYTSVTGDFSKESGTIKLDPKIHNEKDEIYYKVTVTTDNALTASNEVKVEIVK